jgi:hypothetical protein
VQQTPARKPLEERLLRARSQIEAQQETAAPAVFRDVDVRVAWDKLTVERRPRVLDALVGRIKVGAATGSPDGSISSASTSSGTFERRATRAVR